MNISEQEMKNMILHEIPALLERDPKMRTQLWQLITPYFASRSETQSRFDELLAELRYMREESDRKWKEEREESEREWQEWLAESRRKRQEEREESERKWQELRNEFREEMRLIREEFDQKKKPAWAEINRIGRKIESKLRAIGARWGISSEQSYRAAMRRMFEENFSIKVINFNEFDKQGEVFGRPDFAELDIVLERKVRFYERRYDRQVSQVILISPMVDPRAVTTIKQLGIKLYSDPDAVILDSDSEAEEGEVN